MTDFVDVLIRSVSEQGSARQKTKNQVLKQLTEVKVELNRVHDVLQALKDNIIQKEGIPAEMLEKHPDMQDKLQGEVNEQTLEDLEHIAVRDEMRKVEALIGQLTSRNPFVHKQVRPFWSPSVFGRGSKLRRSMALMNLAASKFTYVADGDKFDALYYEFERLKKIIVDDIPALRRDLKTERAAIFTDTSLFDQDHYLRFLKHCDSIEQDIGFQSEYVKNASTDLQVLVNTLKQEALFEVHDYYVDLLLHNLFQSYKLEDSSNYIFYLAEELMGLLSQAAILDRTYLSRWRKVCETKNKYKDIDSLESLEMKRELEEAEQLSHENQLALENFVVALYQHHHPNHDDETAKQEMEMKPEEDRFSKQSLFNEIERNNAALRELFCYRFIQTVLQLMPVDDVEKALRHVPHINEFVCTRLCSDANTQSPIKDMSFTQIRCQLLPTKYRDAEEKLFQRIRDSGNFDALKRAPDCFRAGHDHSEWAWSMDSTKSCQSVKSFDITLTPANHFWLLKKFHDFIELVQKIFDRIFTDHTAESTANAEVTPFDDDSHTEELDTIFVKRFKTYA